MCEDKNLITRKTALLVTVLMLVQFYVTESKAVKNGGPM